MPRKSVAVLAVLAATGAALAAAPAASAQAVVIQPGIEIATDVGGCTANFVFDGTGSQAGKVFIGTAAHCVEAVGDDVSTGSGVVFGDVAHLGDQDASATDYAFIQVRSAYVSSVKAAVKGHPTMPTGVTKAADTASGDLIQFSGYGLGFGLTPPTQEQRVGFIANDDADIYEVVGPVIFGDSGGPLAHISSKGAYGIVSRLCLGSVCWVEGPTIEGSLAKAAADGFTVTLRTV
jgi:hypothetical protein